MHAAAFCSLFDICKLFAFDFFILSSSSRQYTAENGKLGDDKGSKSVKFQLLCLHLKRLWYIINF
jgi:hypothetical protein